MANTIDVYFSGNKTSAILAIEDHLLLSLTILKQIFHDIVK